MGAAIPNQASGAAMRTGQTGPWRFAKLPKAENAPRPARMFRPIER